MFFYALMSALNRAIDDPDEEVTWTLKCGAVAESTSWTAKEIMRFTIARKWPGTDAQARTTIRNFGVMEYLLFDPKVERYSIQPKLIDWLFDHATGFYQALFDGPPPSSWTKDKKGSWLKLNDIVFRYIFESIGDSWRDFRHAANTTIGASVTETNERPKTNRQTDYIGERPEFWIVIMTVGLLGPIKQLVVPARADSLRYSLYANKAVDIANGVDRLQKYGVIAIDNGGIVTIAPKLLPRMERFIAAIEANIPKFRAECDAWKANL
jgi:hypothetical protein